MRNEKPAEQVEEAEQANGQAGKALFTPRPRSTIRHSLHLASDQRDVQHSLPQANEGQQPGEAQEEDLQDLFAGVEVDDLGVSLVHPFISGAVYRSPNSDVLPLELPHESVKLTHCLLGGRFQVDVHGHFRKLLEKILQEQKLVALRFDHPALSEGLVLLCHGGQFIEVEIVDFAVDPAGAAEACIVMDH